MKINYYQNILNGNNKVLKFFVYNKTVFME